MSTENDLSTNSGHAIIMDMATRRRGLDPWLEPMRELPFARRVAVKPPDDEDTDARLRVETSQGALEYSVEVKLARPLGLAAIQSLVSRARAQPKTRWLLLAPHVTSSMGAYLQEKGIDYLDLAGNCHIVLPARLLHHVEGRKFDPTVVRTERSRASGGQVVFTLAARPELAGLPVRELADRSGARKSTVANEIKRLEAAGHLATTRGGRRVLRHDLLIDRWVHAYVTTLRSRWLQGRYRTAPQADETLEAAVAGALDGAVWAWGGATAEMRLLKYYRGETTTIHVATPSPDLPKRLRALPDRDGPLVVVVTPVPVAFEGKAERTVHPLLIYAELLASNEERARNAAERIREEYLTRKA